VRQEIERKFLVNSDAWRGLAAGVHIRQGYLSFARGRTVRVRTVGGQGFLTIKGSRRGISRAEFEYPIPLADADHMLDYLCEQPLIDKTRHEIPHAGFTWEVDEFHGRNAGLVVAEIELPSEDAAFEKPDWVGEEVSLDPRYSNSHLVRAPFSTWPK
jgi:CYTH domain-containing protein